MLKVFKRVFVFVLAAAICFTGTLFAESVSAATGPTDYQKEVAKKLTIGETVKGTLLGSSNQETKSTYYMIKIKHTYDFVFSVVCEGDCANNVEVQVWNSKGVLLRNGNSSKANWVYDKDKNQSKDEFTLKKKKAGKYYIEIKESHSTEGIEYSLRGTVKLRDKVKNVAAKQTAAGSKKVTVTWTPLTINDDSVKIKGYKVYVVTKKGGKKKTALKATIGDPTAKSAEIKISDPGKTYYVYVKAFYFSKNSDKNLFSKASAKYKLVTTKA